MGRILTEISCRSRWALGRIASKNLSSGSVYAINCNPSYWGRDLNVNVGKYNFDAMVVKYYSDVTVILEALKAGEFDFMEVNRSKQWTKDVGGDKWDKGYLVKETLPHKSTAGMQGFAFNLRRPLFHNRDVRHALSLALDFNWMNSSLFYGSTPRTRAFSTTPNWRWGLPASAELALLEPWRASFPPPCLPSPWRDWVSTIPMCGSAFASRATALEKSWLGGAEWRVDRNRHRPAHAVYHHAGSGGFPAHR